VGRKAVGKDKLLVDPGDPEGSYLLDKMVPGKDIDGVLMPLGGDPLPPEQLETISSWISSLPPAAETEPEPPDVAAAPETKPFRGTDQIVLPTTTTLGKLTMQYRIDHHWRDHRFGEDAAGRRLVRAEYADRQDDIHSGFGKRPVDRRVHTAQCPVTDIPGVREKLDIHGAGNGVENGPAEKLD